MKHGLFEAAHQGTIFLDEIAELTPALQVKLLRVLESGTFRRVGGMSDIRVDVRVIAATNRSLEDMLEERQFREDLYYRLNVFPIDVPPLRDRPEDIPALVEHFVRNRTEKASAAVPIHPAVSELLVSYRWPGNVRELEHVIERAWILSGGGSIEPRHLPAALRMSGAARREPVDRSVALEDVEQRHIERVLEQCKGHRENAARLLRISERTLYRRLKATRLQESQVPPGDPVAEEDFASLEA